MQRRVGYPANPAPPPWPRPDAGPVVARRPAGQTLVQAAHDHLLAMLMTVRIAPGERIAIDAVARELGISQTPIREALSRLEAEKLVFKMPNVGYRASPRMSRAEVNDLYALRLLIEPYAARHAAAALDEAAIARLAALAGDATVVPGGGVGDDMGVARFAAADAELHRLIATASGNRLIAGTIERLHAHLQIFRSLRATDGAREAADEHRAMIDALLARDGAAAEQAMRTHLARSRKRMDRVSSAMADAEADGADA